MTTVLAADVFVSLFRPTRRSVELGEGHVNIVRPHELLLTNKHLVLATECARKPSSPPLHQASRWYVFLRSFLLSPSLRVHGSRSQPHCSMLIYRRRCCSFRPVTVVTPPLLQIQRWWDSRELRNEKAHQRRPRVARARPPRHPRASELPQVTSHSRLSARCYHNRYFFLQIVSAVSHCHHRNIVYRDVKLVNILLDGSEPPVVQLCDFGVAR